MTLYWKQTKLRYISIVEREVTKEQAQELIKLWEELMNYGDKAEYELRDGKKVIEHATITK